MPINKFDKGRGNVSGGANDPCAFNYVMREGLYSPENVVEHKKPLGVTLINLVERDTQGRTWGEQMDHTRELKYAETNYWSTTPRTYMSFKLSPDPKDKISLEDFDDFCREFADRAFEQKFQIAIVYHDDNENNILHAHFIVNSPILGETSKVNYLSNWLDSKARLRFIMDLPDYMARERGWSNFLDDAVNKEKAFEASKRNVFDEEESYVNKKKIEEDIEQKYRENELFYKNNYYFDSKKFNFEKSVPRISYEERYKTSCEREIERNGKIPWKKEIKDRIDIVKHLAVSEKEFITMLNSAGVVCVLNKNNEYQYSVKNMEFLKVNGSTLGNAYCKKTILQNLSKNLNLLRKTRLNSVHVDENDNVIFDRYKIDVLRKGALYGKREREIIAQTGWSQNEDIRQRIEYAVKVSSSEAEFIKNLTDFGINVEITNNGDFKYCHPDPDVKLRVTGERLGGPDGLYSRQTIAQKLGFNNYKSGDLFRNLTTKKLSNFEIYLNNRLAIAKSLEGYGLIGMTLVRNPNNISLERFAKACQTRINYEIFSSLDFDYHIKNEPDNSDLIDARNVLFELCGSVERLDSDTFLDVIDTKISALDTTSFDEKRAEKMKQIDKKRKKKQQKIQSGFDYSHEDGDRTSRGFKR